MLVNRNFDAINGSIDGTVNALQIGEKTLVLSLSVGAFECGERYTVTLGSEDYSLFFTDLPVVRLYAYDTIVDTPQVPARFELINDGDAKISSFVGIEIRGGMSQSYPKKCYEIKFRVDSLGSDTHDVALLKSFEDDGWNLQALYNEPLRINSKTASQIWKRIHPQVHYQNKEPEALSGFEMEYTELFLNGTTRWTSSTGEYSFWTGISDILRPLRRIVSEARAIHFLSLTRIAGNWCLTPVAGLVTG